MDSIQHKMRSYYNSFRKKSIKVHGINSSNLIPQRFLSRVQCTLGICPQWTKEPLWNVIFGLFYHYDCSLHHKWAEPSRGNVLSAQWTVHSALLPNWRCEAVRRKPPLRCSRKLNLEQFCFCAGRSDGFAGGTVGVWSSEILGCFISFRVNRRLNFDFLIFVCFV